MCADLPPRSGDRRAGAPLVALRRAVRPRGSSPPAVHGVDDGVAYTPGLAGVSESSVEHSAGDRGVPQAQSPNPSPLLFSRSAGWDAGLGCWPALPFRCSACMIIQVKMGSTARVMPPPLPPTLVVSPPSLGSCRSCVSWSLGGDYSRRLCFPPTEPRGSKAPS